MRPCSLDECKDGVVLIKYEPHTKHGWENGHHGNGHSHHHHHHHHHGRASSEDSWFSGSDNELSSGDESSERSATSSTSFLKHHHHYHYHHHYHHHHHHRDRHQHQHHNPLSPPRNNLSNGHHRQLRQTLNKAKALWSRPHGGTRGDPSPAAPTTTIPVPPGGMVDPGAQQQPPGRLARWLSIRRGASNQYELDNSTGGHLDRGLAPSKMPLLSEVEEESVVHPVATAVPPSGFCRRTAPPTLPPVPQNLTPQQLKRRHIIAAIVHSENSYITTLQRLVNDFKKPLEESSPAILSRNKIGILFKKLPEILQCHNIFRIALAEAIRTWDRDERIGEVFVGSFSKNIVLDIYSGFINNFSAAMDLAKTESKRKSALSDFFQVKQMSSPDRLSFFALMVKPVQRFPQFILFLQDLLKHTPHGHHDRMNLQHALTQLESLAEMLNERKREAEQLQAFKEMLRHVSGKFAARPLSDANRCLLREDDVVQLEFNGAGGVAKSKPRRLLLLNDLLLCVAVAPRSTSASSNAPPPPPRLSLKWTHPVCDVEVLDTSASPTLSRLLTASVAAGSSVHRSGSLKRDTTDGNSSNSAVDDICQDMADLMHDYEVLSRITDLAGTLKGSYKGLSSESLRGFLNEIQLCIQQKDEAMAWVDACCLQLRLLRGGEGGGGAGGNGGTNGADDTDVDVVTFQTANPQVKREWTTELRLAQLALDPNNAPSAWQIPDEEHRPQTKTPLFVKSQCVYASPHHTEVRSGCFYTISSSLSSSNSTKALSRRSRQQNYLWTCSSDGVSSHIAILQQSGQHASQLRPLVTFDLTEVTVTCVEHVRGTAAGGADDQVWVGTDSGRIWVYAAAEPESEDALGLVNLPSAITHIRYHGDNVFVALANGQLVFYRRDTDGHWPSTSSASTTATTLVLGGDAVTCLLPINTNIYAACGKTVSVICAYSGDIQKNFTVQHEQCGGNVNLMAHSGVGLWIALKHSSTICLYHTETFRHLQDINIATNVLRVINPTSASTSCNDCATRSNNNNNAGLVYVTALMACKGLLWVGTNVGVVLTIPLPRLEGVPIISGRFNISYHAHFGPIYFLLALQPRTHIAPASVMGLTSAHATTPPRSDSDCKANSEKLQKLFVDKLKQQLVASPALSRRKPLLTTTTKKKSLEEDKSQRRRSKTLPRGGSTSSSQGSADRCDVYGLYGELMNCRDVIDCDATAAATAHAQCYDAAGRDASTATDRDSSINATAGSNSNGNTNSTMLRRNSDPDVGAVGSKLATLDRRLRMRTTRPRSLDLSNWSVESHASSLYSSATESDESVLVTITGNDQDDVTLASTGNDILTQERTTKGSSNTSCREGKIKRADSTSALPSGYLGEKNDCRQLLCREDSNDIERKSTSESSKPNKSEATSKLEALPGNLNSKQQRGNRNAATDNSRRTVITLMGGRGYVNWRQTCCAPSSGKSGNHHHKPPNTTDAHVVIWETKL